MKRIVPLLLTLALAFAAAPALAAGELTVQQENFHAVSGWWNYGYAYAKVENTGDAPIKLNAGVLEIYDGAGGVITSSDILTAYAAYLQPGEYTYAALSAEISEAEKLAAAADHALTLAGKADESARSLRLLAEPRLEMYVSDGWWTHNYMYATVTNQTDQPVFGITVVFALLDAEGNILYLDHDSLYADRALTPGSSMIIRSDISSSFMDYFAANGLSPASLDVIAYADVSAE